MAYLVGVTAPQPPTPGQNAPTTLTDHVFPHMSHGVKFLLADLAGELLLGIAVDDLIVFVQRPELLKPFPAGHTLQGKEWDKKGKNGGEVGKRPGRMTRDEGQAAPWDKLTPPLG